MSIDTETSDVDYTQPAVLPEDVDAAKERANWHARMVRKLTADKHELTDMFDTEYSRLVAELERLSERREHHARIIQDKIDWHQAPIESYHRMRLVADPKLKTLPLLHGYSKITVPVTAKVFPKPNADADVLKWAREKHPEILKAPNITDVRGVVAVRSDMKVIDKATGETVECLVAQVPDSTWGFDPEPGSPW
jgi:CBS-domain-containing membrane protein